MTDDETAFHIEEYKQMRTEVMGLLGRVEQLFRYSIVVSASVTAWLLTSTLGANNADIVCVKVPRDFAALGWFIAPAFVLVAGLMASVTMYRVVQMGRYLRRLERSLGRRHLGWEQYIESKPWLVTISTLIVWLLLLIASTSIACKAYPVVTRASETCISFNPARYLGGRIPKPETVEALITAAAQVFRQSGGRLWTVGNHTRIDQGGDGQQFHLIPVQTGVLRRFDSDALKRVG